MEQSELFATNFVTTICEWISSENPDAPAFTFLMIFKQGEWEMSEFDEEVKKAEKELEQSLVPLVSEDEFAGKAADDEYLGDLRMQAQEYGQKLQDAAVKARDYASEKLTQAGDKFKELQNKDPKEILEDAKDYARKEPGKALLISAAVGLVLGFLIKRR
ncbi:MAG TPA: hypothetical protein VL325_05085 [Pyrinomonadaceae bacterium]|nr:hypothetical protein [Pyrinomonadaceae bacterium]